MIKITWKSQLWAMSLLFVYLHTKSSPPTSLSVVVKVLDSPEGRCHGLEYGHALGSQFCTPWKVWALDSS